MPIPYFVATVNGKPDFRLSDPAKIWNAYKNRLCFTCGQGLGRNLAFVIGPMCCLNRTTSEPPSHLDCAQWSVKGCPFLSRPKMVRREDDFTESLKENVSGVMLKRNPGVMAIWITTDYEPFSDGMGGMLFQIDEPLDVTWWREGRPATRAEILESVAGGLPKLQEMCAQERTPLRQEQARSELVRRQRYMEEQLLPPD